MPTVKHRHRPGIAWTLLVALLWLIVALLWLTACQSEHADQPPPEAVTPDREAMTYYGRMILVDHRGPKAQIHLESRDAPLWFSQVRDAVAFTLSPEEPNDIAAIHVTDMARADGWDQPQTWMPAEEAVYVIDSERRGGMGALETVPFSERVAAEAFAAEHGGELMSWDEITEDYIFERSIKAVESPRMMQHDH